MAVDGFNVESLKTERIQSLENIISKGAEKVQNLGDKTVDELELELDLRQPTTEEVVRQFNDDGYEIYHTDRQTIETLGSPAGESRIISFEEIVFRKPGEEPVIKYFEFNQETNGYELAKNQESAEKAYKRIKELGSFGMD